MPKHTLEAVGATFNSSFTNVAVTAWLRVFHPLSLGLRIDENQAARLPAPSVSGGGVDFRGSSHTGDQIYPLHVGQQDAADRALVCVCRHANPFGE